MGATLDLFETRTMLRVMEQMKPPKKFLLNNFFPNIEQSMSENVDIDIWRGKRRTGFYVNPMQEGKVVDRVGFATNTYKPPYMKMKMTTRAEDFIRRMPGETIYGSNDSPMSRAAKQVGLDLATMDDMLTRALELQAAQVLQTGKVTVTGEGQAATIDFGFAATHLPVLAGAALWSASTSAPIDDLTAWRRIIMQDSGLHPTDIIMGTAAYDAFRNNAAVKDHFNKWWMNFGMIQPVVEPMDNVVFVGKIQELNMNIWVYEEWYIDNADDTEKAIIGANNVIMATKGARTGQHFGAIKDLKAQFAVPRFPKSWETEDPSARWIMLQSAPLVAIHQVDAFLCGTVL